MTNAELNVKIAEQQKEIGSLKHRMNDCERKTENISKLLSSIDKLALNMDYMAKEQAEQGKRLARLEEEPLKNAKNTRTTIITAIITAVVGLAIGSLWAFIFK